MMARPRAFHLWLLAGVVALGYLWLRAQSQTGAAADRVAGSESRRQFGALSFSPCRIGGGGGVPSLTAWCSEYSVPENRAGPAGRHIALKVAIVPSTASEPRADWLTYLDGGPGGAATETWPSLHAALEPMRRLRHVLLIDQRGTGGSNALRCESDAQALDAFDPRALDGAHIQALLRECLIALAPHANARHYTTGDAVEDLEAVRRAVGAPLLNVLGISYGTRLAQQYARRHPASVRSLILDGVVPNRLIMPAEHARNLDIALQSYAALCAAKPACRSKFGDPYLALHRLHRTLRSAPIDTRLVDAQSGEVREVRVSADLLAGAARLYSYSPISAALLPAAVQAAERGNFSPLLGQAATIAEDLGDRLNQGMAMSVGCSDDAEFLRRQAGDEHTLLGHSLVDATLAACAVWPRGARIEDFHAPLQGGVPTLLLSGEHDPVTPVRYADEVAEHLSNALALMAKGQGHGVSTVGCMPRLLDEFLDRLQPRQLDHACLDRLGDTPALLDLNGAGP